MEWSKIKAERSKVKAFLGLRVTVCLLLLLAAAATKSQAQTFAEWFQQGKTQIKYLSRQIAALTACEQSLKQGYNIAKSEWGAISSVKNGEFLLHRGYYRSLRAVNPLVKDDADVASVQAEQQSIISQFTSIRDVQGLSGAEQAYVGSVEAKVLADCVADLNELETVLTPGRLVLTDDERMHRIDRVKASMKEKYVFSCGFCSNVRLLALQRIHDNQGIHILNQLYGTGN